MKRVEFRLSMPNCGSWNGSWSGEGRDYLKFKTISNKQVTLLGLEKSDTNSWHYSWSDGWGANISVRIMEKGEKRKKSAGFSGYDWMVDDILCYGKIRQREEG